MSERDYSGAAAWCEEERDTYAFMGVAFAVTHATLARDAVSAWMAIERGDVALSHTPFGWQAKRRGPRGAYHDAPDPLSAVLAAMEAK